MFAKFFISKSAFYAVVIYLVAIPLACAQSLNDIKYTDDMWTDDYRMLENSDPYYLTKDQEFPIPPPFENDRPETKEELRIVKYLEKEMRTPEIVKRIFDEQDGRSDLIFGLGEDIPENVETMVNDLRYEATYDSYHFIYRTKRQFKRARPYQLDPELTLVTPVRETPAYPSGHSAIAWMAGRVFSYIDTKNRLEYTRLAGDVGLRRTITGIHYPSDSEASRLLVDQIFDALLEKPEFRKQMDEAKASYEALGPEKEAEAEDAVLALKNLRHPEDKWDADYLAVIDRGTSFLGAEVKIDIEPPPANDSNETMRELVLLREYGAVYRTPDQVDKILDENGRSSELLAGGPLIEPFYDNDVLWESLWPQAYQDVTYFLMLAKRQYDRPRPTQLDPDLGTVIDAPQHASYPSGHAVHMPMLAHILGAIDPAHKEDYKQMAFEIARRREFAGIHYPSDTQAGIKLTDDVFEKLMQVPEFVQEIEKARAEFGQDTAKVQKDVHKEDASEEDLHKL